MAELELSEVLTGALDGVYDPCCRELGLSIIDMGVVRSAKLEGGVADIKLTLTSGWCPSMATIVSEAEAAICAIPGVRTANVEVSWDEAWSPERMSDVARAKLRFLPAPKDASISDRAAALAGLRRGEFGVIGDAFVFDCVAHPFNFEPSNAYGAAGQMFSNHLYAFHKVLTPPGEPVLSEDEFLKRWDIEEIRQMVYSKSSTDMLVAMPLPLTDLFRDGGSPWEECARLAALDPDRTVFWGSVNPLEGRAALNLMERQVKEHNAKAFKFYNVRYDSGQPFPWRMDDPKVAFPVFEKAQELGVKIIGVHKGVPLGPQPIEHTQTWDMDGAAANFPELNFVHLPCWASVHR